MSDYQRSIEVAARPEAAFAFLSDPRNLPRYVATVVEAEPSGEGTLRIAAEVQGRHEEGDALLQLDPGSRRMGWRAGGDSEYTGSLEVSPAGDGSAVTLRIHLAREQDEAELNRVLDETAANIQRLLADT